MPREHYHLDSFANRDCCFESSQVELDLSTDPHPDETVRRTIGNRATLVVRSGAAGLQTYFTSEEFREIATGMLGGADALDALASLIFSAGDAADDAVQVDIGYAAPSSDDLRNLLARAHALAQWKRFEGTQQ